MEKKINPHPSLPVIMVNNGSEKHKTGTAQFGVWKTTAIANVQPQSKEPLNQYLASYPLLSNVLSHSSLPRNTQAFNRKSKNRLSLNANFFSRFFKSNGSSENRPLPSRSNPQNIKHNGANMVRSCSIQGSSRDAALSQITSANHPVADQQKTSSFPDSKCSRKTDESISSESTKADCTEMSLLINIYHELRVKYPRPDWESLIKP